MAIIIICSIALFNWDPAMSHSCSGIWSPAPASAQEAIWAQQLHGLGRLGWQTGTVTWTCWFGTAQSPAWGTSTQSISTVLHQCLAGLSLWKPGCFSCTPKSSSLARETMAAFPFAPNCRNSAFPEGLVDFKLLHEAFSRFVCAISTQEDWDAGQNDISPLYYWVWDPCGKRSHWTTLGFSRGKACVLCHLSHPCLTEILGEIKHVFNSPGPFCPILNGYWSFWEEALWKFCLNLLIRYPAGLLRTQPLALESFVTSVN